HLTLGTPAPLCKTPQYLKLLKIWRRPKIKVLIIIQGPTVNRVVGVIFMEYIVQLVITLENKHKLTTKDFYDKMSIIIAVCTI
uniref:Uncharacterized protein n=1 Tax=Romanomermis culicivorax TaxID=13658 RepID=A0A915HV94_ROMCU